jgi:hypothetical protein
MSTSACDDCGNQFSLALEQCPHCGHTGPAPNVKAAGLPEEKEALDRRYRAALGDADSRGCRVAVDAFAAALAGSKAVINCHFAEAERLASSDGNFYASYYERLRGGLHGPYGDAWDLLRKVADVTLFTNYEDKIHFAALSLDGVGVRSYGECSLVLREPMIAHRTSVFEENSAAFLGKRQRLQRGFRAPWADRMKLCVAKLSAQVEAGTAAAQFPALLLFQGGTPEEDRFVEVHIWGSLSIRTCERVILQSEPRKTRQVLVKALRMKLAAVGVAMEKG